MRFAMPRFMISEHPFPWLFPLIAMLLVFAVFPLAYNIYLSFHEFAIFKRSLVYVGWDNWLKIFNDTRLNNALFINITYTIVCLSIQLVLGFLIALLLDTANLPIQILSNWKPNIGLVMQLTVNT